MSDVWIYAEALGAIGSDVEIAASEAKHAMGARRLGTGDSVTLFDGMGTTAYATILDGRSRHGERAARVHAVASNPRPARPLTIAFAVPKGDRLATLLDMTTQAGVDRLIPIDCERSVIHEAKLTRNERSQRILVEACKQSRRAWIPELVAGGSLEEVATREHARGAQGVVAHLSWDAKPMGDVLRAMLAQSTSAGITVWIGPEGGFTEREVAALRVFGNSIVTLCAHVLRIETAAVAAACVYADLRR